MSRLRFLLRVPFKASFKGLHIGSTITRVVRFRGLGFL